MECILFDEYLLKEYKNSIIANIVSRTRHLIAFSVLESTILEKVNLNRGAGGKQKSE